MLEEAFLQSEKNLKNKLTVLNKRSDVIIVNIKIQVEKIYIQIYKSNINKK
jgi:hypothetical protein